MASKDYRNNIQRLNIAFILDFLFCIMRMEITIFVPFMHWCNYIAHRNNTLMHNDAYQFTELKEGDALELPSESEWDEEDPAEPDGED